MNEREFLLKLQERAHEQEKVIRDMPFPHAFSAISSWLGNHPWRYLIPLAFLISLLLRGIFGTGYINFILWMFRKI